MSQEFVEKTMEDLKKYGGGDEAVVTGIVKHLGIALRSKDASLVSCSDPSELKRVREGFMKKKLALADSDAKLDEAIQGVCEQMKDSRQKMRTTFCYLLTKKFGKESLFK